ncbi:MAG: hypothetical protein GX962_14250 [Epulopiscium sp.]|nr:hypothetical protein [Candidatus Epulonipiscium sp.]
MELNAKDVVDVLDNKGIKYLYHANTVLTSCTFLKNSGLLSRGAVESHNLRQTYQYTDQIDKQYNIWYDIFLDNCDIHKRGSNRNLYGPVLFCFDLKILLRKALPPIYITKKNPSNWDNTDHKGDRYFQSIEELEKEYIFGTYGHTITLKNTNQVLPFGRDLKQIIIDDPQVDNLYKNAVEEIIKAGKKGNINNIKNLIIRRECNLNCKCEQYYYENKMDLNRLFSMDGDK